MEFKETSVGSSYGPVRSSAYTQPHGATSTVSQAHSVSYPQSWATVWFRVTVAPPAPGEPVWLIWDAGCESMVYAEDGTAMQGLTGGSGADQRHEVLLADRMTGLPHAALLRLAVLTRAGALQSPRPCTWRWRAMACLGSATAA